MYHKSHQILVYSQWQEVHSHCCVSFCFCFHQTWCYLQIYVMAETEAKTCSQHFELSPCPTAPSTYTVCHKCTPKKIVPIAEIIPLLWLKGWGVWYGKMVTRLGAIPDSVLEDQTKQYLGDHMLPQPYPGPHNCKVSVLPQNYFCSPENNFFVLGSCSEMLRSYSSLGAQRSLLAVLVCQGSKPSLLHFI